jgi:glyoxylase-like metal-dependent hydrolase (beta-lactamase superfamily II)
MYLIKGKEANYLIDTGFGSATAEYIAGYVEANCPNDIIVINTHYHWDHIWGNIGFEGRTIVAHEKAYELINEKWDEMVAKGGKFKDGQIKKVLPNTLISDRLVFPEDGIEVFYTPGHTADSISVYDRFDGVLYVGDNVETLVPEVYDTQSNYIRSIEQYLGFDFSFSIAGHNSNVTREDLETIWKTVSKNP